MAAVLLGAVAALLALQVAALAHPVDVDLPPNYESRVTALQGEHGDVRARVVGGDAFMVLEVPEGVEVEVPGYDVGEEYLRIDPTGHVYANIAGPTHHFNAGDVPDLRLRSDLRADAEPEWRRVASDGRHAWADYRIRWLGPDPTPPQLDTDRAQPVRDWEIPIVVDGEPVVITGELAWVPTPSPALPLALGVLVAVAGIARRSTTVSAVLVAVAAAAMVVVGLSELGVPGDEPFSHVADLTAAAVALLLALRSAARRTPPTTRAAMLAAAALGVGVAVAYNLWIITTAVLPGWLPSIVARPLLGVAAGAAAAGLVTAALALRRPGEPAEVDEVPAQT
jgi:hypothetical protein